LGGTVENNTDTNLWTNNVWNTWRFEILQGGGHYFIRMFKDGVRLLSTERKGDFGTILELTGNFGGNDLLQCRLRGEDDTVQIRNTFIVPAERHIATIVSRTSNFAQGNALAGDYIDNITEFVSGELVDAIEITNAFDTVTVISEFGDIAFGAELPNNVFAQNQIAVLNRAGYLPLHRRQNNPHLTQSGHHQEILYNFQNPKGDH